MSAPGQVFAHAAQPLTRQAYDVVVVGAGRLGLACAFHLRERLPSARVLVVERGGIPHEEGATLNAPGVWHRADLPDAWRARAAWVRRLWADPGAVTGTERPHDPAFVASGWLRLGAALGAPPEGVQAVATADLPGLLPARAAAQLADLLDLGALPEAWLDPQGGYGSASTLALSYGYGAVWLGADLLLNSEAHLTDVGVRVERLTVTRTHEVVVAETLEVRAPTVVVAAGSEGPGLLEEGLGVVLPHRRAWVQFPRLHVPLAPDLPVVWAAGVGLRPRDGGFQVVTPDLGPDPQGYAPRGGRVAGVPVGARRELLDVLMGALPVWPALAAEGLNLGRSAADLPGAWEARPAGGWPTWQQVAEGRYLLLGGPESDRVGPAVALDLAATLAGTPERPWDELE